MTDERFASITANCQPHKVFSSDWGHFYSDDFADTLLPDAGIIKGTFLRFYDGAEIVPQCSSFPQRLMMLPPLSHPISLTVFSYPKGVKAGSKWQSVRPSNDELCAFIEVDKDDGLSVHIKTGDAFKEILRSSVGNKSKDLTSRIATLALQTDLSNFKSYFTTEISHYRMLSYIGHLIGVDFEKKSEQNDTAVLLTSVRAYTSEPAGNKNRREPEPPRLQLRVDFRIISTDIHHCNVSIFKNGEEVYHSVNLPGIIYSEREETAGRMFTILNELQIVEQGIPPAYAGRIPPGDYFFYWDCTGYIDRKEEIESLTIQFEAVSQIGNTCAMLHHVEDVQGLFEKLESNNYIVVLNDNEEERWVYGNEIIERQRRFISKIPKEVYDGLKEAHKLILHLPEIMVKLDWLHGALCQIHWLEGSGESLTFPYEFFMGEERVKNVDRKNLEEYFKDIRYLSIENLSFAPSNPDGKNLFLYDALDDTTKAYRSFYRNLAKRTANGTIGGNEKFKKNKRDNVVPVNENFFQSFSVGSELGDFDDIGAALGLYAQRCYYQGFLYKEDGNNNWLLDIHSVKCRFFDDFNFKDEELSLNPKTWSSQPLGVWNFDLNKPQKPVRTFLEIIFNDGKWYKLNNKTFRDLKGILQKCLVNPCEDFYIHSSLKTIDDEFLKKIIRIY